MKLAVIAARRPHCGIADYARRIVACLPPDIQADWVDTAACVRVRDWARAARRAARADVVHVHYEYTLFGHVSPLRNGYAALMRRLEPPAVVTLHDRFPPLARPWTLVAREGPTALLRQAAYVPFRRTWAARQYGYAARAVAHTQAIAGAAAETLGPGRVDLWPHPVPRCTRRWTVSAARAPVLVTPGFVKEHKGYREALPLLAARPDWHWWLAGGPQDARDARFLASLRAEAARLGVAARLHVTGYLSEARLEALAVRARLALFPFRSVTGSGSVNWAAGLGLPIAAADLPPLRRMHDDGAGLRLLPSGNPGAWEGLLAELLARDDDLAQLAQANTVYARAYSYERFGAFMAGVFSAAAGTGAPPPRPGGAP